VIVVGKNYMEKMMTKVDAFNKNVFNYISTEYGNSTLKKVQTSKNKDRVKYLLEDSRNRNYDTDKTANKIIAMLRLNP
jgi:23S rRNA maturation mini-RNase III